MSAESSQVAIKLFISYARRDGRELALRLREDLKTAGYEVWLDTNEIDGGASWSDEIEKAIDTCQIGLVLLSDSSYRSEICRGEQSRLLRKGKRVIPLLVQTTADRPVYLEHLNYRDFSNLTKYVEMLTLLKDDIAASEYTPVPERFRRTAVTNAPARPPNFLERPLVLNTLRDLVTRDSTDRRIGLTAMHGMGGIGKSVTAAALCHDQVIQDAFPDGVVWVTIGREPGNLTDKFLQIGKALGGSDSDYQKYDEAISSYRKLLTEKAAFVVLDDVWNYEHLQPFIVEGAPASRLIFTTRDNGIIVEAGAIPYRLDTLNKEEALDLLGTWTSRKREKLPPEATTLAEQCGYLPLALALCGAQLKSKTPYSDLLEALQQADLDLIDPPDIGDLNNPDVLARAKPERSICASIKVSIEALRKENDAYATCYERLAVFPEDTEIPEAAILTFWTQGSGNSKDELRFRKLITTLANRAMITVEGEQPKRIIRLHDIQNRYLISLYPSLEPLHKDLVEAYRTKCGGVWAKGTSDGYFFERLAYHLRESGKKDELYTLLTDSPAWMEAKYIACVGDRAYVDDLELAISDFRDPLKAEQVVTLAKLWTARQVVNARVSLYQDIDLKTLVWMGRTQEAISHAKLRPDAKGKVDGLMAIYEAQQKHGDADIGLLLQALDFARALEGAYSHADALRDIAAALAQAGRDAGAVFDEALRTARAIKRASFRAAALCDVAAALAQAGHDADAVFDEALRTASAIDDAYSRADALQDIAVALAQVGRFDEALTTAHAIENAHTRADALRYIAAALAQVGRFDEALHTARTIEDVYIRDVALRGIATALAQTGHSASHIFDEALHTARTIEDVYIRDVALRDIATALAQTGHSASHIFDEALHTTRAIEDVSTRTYALRDIAMKLAQTGHSASHIFDEALRTARTIEDVYIRTNALQNIAAALAQVGRFDEALTTAHAIENDDFRADALRDIATALAQTGHSASRIFDEALNTTRTIENDNSRADALRDIAAALAQADCFDEALTTARVIADAFTCTYALRAIAMKLAQSGHDATGIFDEALTSARTIENDDFRADALRDIADALAQTSLFDKALNTARTIEDVYLRTYTLCVIANIFAQAGYDAVTFFDEALSTAHAIEHADTYADALSDIANALAQAGRFDEALNTARAIEDVSTRFALRAIATALAQAGRFDEALNTARAIADAYFRANALRAIATNLAQAERDASVVFDEALSTASAIENADSRTYTLRAIADAFAQASRFDEALSTARTIDSTSSRADTLRAIANTLAQAGRDASAVFDEALTIAHALDAFSCANTLRAIAAALAQAGNITTAFGEVGLRELAEYLSILGEWGQGFEKIEQGLTIKVLREAVRIVAWEKPQWNEIHAILVKATEGG